MSLPANRANASTFVLGQPLFQLTRGSPEAQWQAALAESEPIDELREAASFRDALKVPVRPGQQPPPPSAWHRWDRDKLVTLLSNPPEDDWRRVAFICRAGLGKTTN